MITLTDGQQKEFDVWLEKYIKEIGHDFVFGFFVILEGEDKMMHVSDPEYTEWYESKKKEFLENQYSIKIRIDYDDRADQVVDKISEKLEQFGLKINWIDSVNDGFDEFEIVKIK